MDLTHEVSFSLLSPMTLAEAKAFVVDVPASLRYADFLAELQVLVGDLPVVCAAIPVSAAMFGQRELPFRSELHLTHDGARLVPIGIEPNGPGWAEVAGEARVSEEGRQRRLDYSFQVTVHLRLPPAERWGTQALVRMIEFTATSVLRKITAQLPAAVSRAAGVSTVVA